MTTIGAGDLDLRALRLQEGEMNIMTGRKWHLDVCPCQAKTGLELPVDDWMDQREEKKCKICRAWLVKQLAKHGTVYTPTNKRRAAELGRLRPPRRYGTSACEDGWSLAGSIRRLPRPGPRTLEKSDELADDRRPNWQHWFW